MSVRTLALAAFVLAAALSPSVAVEAIADIYPFEKDKSVAIYPSWKDDFADLPISMTVGLVATAGLAARPPSLALKPKPAALSPSPARQPAFAAQEISDSAAAAGSRFTRTCPTRPCTGSSCRSTSTTS